MTPTQEQIKEFWEGCGFQFFRPIENGAIDVIYPDGSMCLSPSKIALPLIDLNNLFKYAVPKIGYYQINNWNKKKDSVAFVWLEDETGGKTYKGTDKDPALALFWAIREIIIARN